MATSTTMTSQDKEEDRITAPMATPSSISRAYSNNKESASANNEERILWSELFSSSQNGDAFSPAKPTADKKSLHGTGLQLCLEKGKLEARCGRRCSLMLLETASCYEQFGMALKKSCQKQQQQQDTPTDGDSFLLPSVVSLGQQTRTLSNQLREEIALPLQGFHTNCQGETLVVMQQKYVQTRQRAFDARKRALVGHDKYVHAVQEADAACNEMQATFASSVTIATATTDKEEKVDEHADDAEKQPTSDRSLKGYEKLKGKDAADRVASLLNDVKVQQRRYESLVERENEAVRFAQNMESIALEGIQKLEEQRLCLFYDSLVRTVQGVNTCLDDLVIAADGDGNKESTTATPLKEDEGDHTNINNALQKNYKKGEELFANLLKVGHGHENTGVVDAETLGLDVQVGTLRDEVQSRMAAKVVRLKRVKGLAVFFEEIAVAAANLGTGLMLVVKHEDSYVSSQGTPVEHLRTLLSNCEGPRTLSLWNDVLKMLESEARASQQFATALRTIKSSTLDPVLLTSVKSVKDEAEMDDGRWKVLCDAARAEMRAETKYRQNIAHTAKARDRVKSVDSGDATAAEKAVKSSPKKVNRTRDGMNKAFGNFLSILPDGGEQAMQMLTPEARRAVAERTLQEADQKEAKVKQALDNAIAHKNQCVESYESKTAPRSQQFKEEAIAGVDGIKIALGDLLASMNSLRATRYESLVTLPKLGEKPLVDALIDLREWMQKAAEDVAAKLAGDRGDASSSATSGFMLDVVLSKSEHVADFVGIGKTTSFESDCVSDASAGSVVAVQVPGQDSNRSLDLASVKNEGDAENNDSKNSRWLQKSLSTPIGKPGFKKLRKSHTTGDDDFDMDIDDDQTANSTDSATVPPQNKEETTETDMFLAFWPDYSGIPPGITHSFACVFLPKDCTTKDIGLVEHGRLFLTHKGAVFVAWKGKKAILYFSAMTSVETRDSLFGLDDDTLLVTAESGGAQNTLLLGSFNLRDRALQVTQERITVAAKARVESEATKQPETNAGPTSNKVACTLTPVAPDAVIQKMEIVLSKKVKGISVDKFHEIVWDDGAADESFYAKWLATGKCSDIKADNWETPTDGFKGAWCGDSYTHKRSLAFILQRSSRIGPPTAKVSQTQFCRLEGKDRSIMQMTVAFEGIPYSDSFSVEVRWVATRVGAKDIMVQVGVFVEFHKSTFLKTQIRNGTMTETKPVHESLFEFVKTALSKEIVLDESGEAGDDDDDDADDVSVAESSRDNATTKQETGILGIIKSTLPAIIADNMHIAIPVAVVASLCVCRGMLSSSASEPTMSLSASSEITALNLKVNNLQGELELLRQTMAELKEIVSKK